MAKSKKSSKKFSAKVNKAVKSDVFTSIAILSILLNVFLLVAVFVFTNPDTYNREVFSNVRARYCKNVDGVVERAEQLGDSDAALKEWKVTCVSDEFAPYYNEAVKKFNAAQ